MTPTTDEQLRAAIAPFAWDPPDTDEILTALAPTVDRLCRQAAATHLEAVEAQIQAMRTNTTNPDRRRAYAGAALTIRGRITTLRAQP